MAVTGSIACELLLEGTCRIRVNNMGSLRPSNGNSTYTNVQIVEHGVASILSLYNVRAYYSNTSAKLQRLALGIVCEILLQP